MSTYVDSTKAVLWIDGDGFRGPANAVAPVDPFAAAPQTGDGSPVVLDAYGAIETGFSIDPNTQKKDYDAWNNQSGSAFLTHIQPGTKSLKFRVMQYSKASVTTLLRGGTISNPAGSVYKWNLGTGEEFSFLVQLKDALAVKKKAFWIARASLAAEPQEILNEDKVDGWEFEVNALAPVGGGLAIQPYTNWNPLA
jgi:hypothetical protein